MENEINVSFSVSGQEDLLYDKLSKELGLDPCRELSKDKGNRWVYGIPYGNMENFDEQMDRILDALEPKIDVLKKYNGKYEYKFRIVIFLRNREVSTPWVFLEKRYNAFIREVDALMDIEVYTPEFGMADLV